ncbi:MAG: hypothetical protein HY720_03880 [Planctomycetes bacterium]|nr:hypothetical protein [Planctomycetota bacterium]
MVFDPILPAPILVLVGAGFVGFPIASYLRRRGTASPRAVGALVGLRASAVVVLVLLAARPAVERSEELSDEAHLAILLDTSRSMGVADMPGGSTRARALESFWRGTEDLRDELERDFELHAYTFDATLAAEEGASFAPEGDRTALGDALDALSTRGEGGRRAGVVVFSDGASNSGASPLAVARRYAADGVRIDAVVVGASEPPESLRDIDLRGLFAPDRVHAGTEIVVSVDLVALACAGETIHLEAELEGAPKKFERAIPDRGRYSRRVVLGPFRVSGKGRKKLAVRATRLPGESTHENNAIESEIEVVKDHRMVLVLEEALRWETKFLVRALSGVPLLETVPVYGTDAAELQDATWLSDFDAVVIGDIRAEHFPARLVENLKALASDGRGVLFLGGAASFGSGAYAGSPLEGLLPVVVAEAPDRVEEAFRARPTPEGLSHFSCRLQETTAASRASWDRLPPLLSRHRAAMAKTGTTVLVLGSGEPLLAVQAYGEGRTAAMLTDSTWRWYFSEEDTAAEHRRFWRQLVLWLAGADENEKGSVLLAFEPNRSLFDSGEGVELRVRVLDGRGNDVESARVDLEVTSPDEAPAYKRTLVYLLEPGTGEGLYRTVYVPEAPGEYRVSASASLAGQPFGEDERAFRVRGRAGELDDPAAQPALLAEVATITGGRCVGLDQARSLFEEARTRKGGVAVRRTWSEPIGSNPALLVVFAGLLAAEWFLRKRLGMV